jgi:AcrR family transcriptional regulator
MRADEKQEPESTPDDAPRWRRRSEARPAEILDAALDLFAEKGFAATRMEEIARRAGVTKGTVYLYYPSKEDVFHAVVRDSVLPRVEEAERMVAEHTGNATELLRSLMAGWWTQFGSKRMSCMGKLLMAESSNFPELTRHYVEAVIVRARRMFVTVLETGVAAGEFRPVPAVDTARLAIAPIAHATAYMRSLAAYDPDPIDIQQYLALHIDIFIRGIAADGAETRHA